LEEKLEAWRSQRLWGAGLFFLLSGVFMNGVRLGRSNTLVTVLTLVAGCYMCVATRRIHVVKQFRQTGSARLRIKSEARTLAFVGVFSLVEGVIFALIIDGNVAGFASILPVAILCFFLTLFATGDAVRKCRSESYAGSQ